MTVQEVESKVRWVMDLEGGRALHGRAKVAKDRALEVDMSHSALLEFLEDLEAKLRDRQTQND